MIQPILAALRRGDLRLRCFTPLPQQDSHDIHHYQERRVRYVLLVTSVIPKNCQTPRSTGKLASIVAEAILLFRLPENAVEQVGACAEGFRGEDTDGMVSETLGHLFGFYDIDGSETFTSDQIGPKPL